MMHNLHVKPISKPRSAEQDNVLSLILTVISTLVLPILQAIQAFLTATKGESSS